MLNKSELLKRMRKHAKTFSSAVGHQKEADQKSINHALALIDLLAKDTNYGSVLKLSINIPSLLKVLRFEENLVSFQTKKDNKDPFNLSANMKKNNNNNKGKDKFKQAEKRLIKLLSTKSC